MRGFMACSPENRYEMHKWAPFAPCPFLPWGGKVSSQQAAYSHNKVNWATVQKMLTDELPLQLSFDR